METRFRRGCNDRITVEGALELVLLSAAIPLLSRSRMHHLLAELKHLVKLNNTGAGTNY